MKILLKSYDLLKSSYDAEPCPPLINLLNFNFALLLEKLNNLKNSIEIFNQKLIIEIIGTEYSKSSWNY